MCPQKSFMKDALLRNWLPSSFPDSSTVFFCWTIRVIIALCWADSSSDCVWIDFMAFRWLVSISLILASCSLSRIPVEWRIFDLRELKKHCVYNLKKPLANHPRMNKIRSRSNMTYLSQSPIPRFKFGKIWFFSEVLLFSNDEVWWDSALELVRIVRIARIFW